MNTKQTQQHSPLDLAQFEGHTLKHLDAWLDEQFGGDTYRAKIRATMIAFASDDVEYWSCQSWWNLFDRAKCNLIERGY